MKGLIFTLVMTYGGAVLALFNPFIGLLIYICFSIIRPDALWHWSVPPGNYSRIVAIGLLVGWLLKGFGSWDLGKARGITVFLILFFGWNVLSASQAVESVEAWNAVESLAKVVLPFLVGITTIDSIEKIKQLVWVIVLSTGFLAFEFNMSYFEGINVIVEFGFGNMEEGNIAAMMVTAIGMAFFLAVAASHWWQKLILWVCTALMVHVVLFSFNRGGMLGLATIGLVSFLLVPKKPIHFLMFILIVATGFRLAGQEVRDRFSTTFAGSEGRGASAEGRLDLWRDCLDVAVKNPLLGVGPRGWRFIAPNYGWPVGKEGHSLWLQFAAELGFLGVLWLVLFYGTCMVRLLSFVRLPSDGPGAWPRYIACMVIASLSGFVLSAQFITLSGLETPYYVVLLGGALLKIGSVATEPSALGAPPETSWSPIFSTPAAMSGVR